MTPKCVSLSVYVSTSVFDQSTDASEVLKNYHQTIVDHKEVIRSSMSLQGAILMLKDDIVTLGNVSLHQIRFNRFSNCLHSEKKK